ncbi:MAG: carotenoid biosynthesis protein [Mucilaginibacter sp.]
MKLSPPKQKWITYLIIIINIVGLTGFIIPATRHIFMALVPWHLLLMSIFMLMSHEQFDRKLVLFMVVIYIPAFFAEWIGVHTQLLFGQYYYGNTLGYKLWGVPVIMGITWFLLIYSTGVTMQRSGIQNMLLRVLTGAVILVLLDMLIEPIAMRFDYWHWAGSIIPLKNYWGWLLISVVMLFAFEAFRFKKQNLVAPLLLLMQFVFFGVLNLVFLLF